MRSLNISCVFCFKFGSRQTEVTNIYDFESGIPDVFESVDLDSCYTGLPKNNIGLYIASRITFYLFPFFIYRIDTVWDINPHIFDLFKKRKKNKKEIKAIVFTNIMKKVS